MIAIALSKVTDAQPDDCQIEGGLSIEAPQTLQTRGRRGAQIERGLTFNKQGRCGSKLDTLAHMWLKGSLFERTHSTDG